MELFKNSVGRPSNEIKKKRRIFIISIILVCIIFVGGLSYLIVSKKSSIKKIKGETYINPYLKMQHYGEYNYYQLYDKYVGEGLVLIKNKNDEVSIAFFPKGDIDFDGSVTENDARLALRAAAKLETLDDLQLLNADLNHDGKVTAGEARKILQQSGNKSGFQNYKACVVKHGQDDSKCNWKNLSVNGWNTKIVENNVKYDVYVYNTTNGDKFGYTEGIIFNGTNKTKTESNVKISFTDKKKTSVDQGKTIDITASTNDTKVSKVWVDDPSLGNVELNKLYKNSDNRRTFTFHAKKAGVAKVYVESSEGAVNSIDIKISKKYVDVINYSGKLYFGGTYDFPIKTNAGKITNINCDGGNCVDKGIVRITGTNGKYTLRVIGVGKTTVNVKTSGGAKASVKIETQATYDDPVSKVFGSKNYYITKIGGIETYVDNACKDQSKYKAILNKLPKYALKSVNRVNIVNDAQADKNIVGKGYAAVTSGGAGTGYGTSITFRCSHSSNAATVTHEFGHAVACTYKIYTGQDLIAYFDKNDKNFNKSTDKRLAKKILRDYSRNSRDEFFADSYSGYILKYTFGYSNKQLANVGRTMQYSTKGIGMDLEGYTKSTINLAKKVIENK